jgi:hypothetical protein
MHLPAPAPPLRGFLLKLVAFFVSYEWARRLIIVKLRKDTGINRLPEGS